MAILIAVQLAFIPIALACAVAALVALGNGYQNEIPQQPKIDFWFYFAGMLGALNIIEAFASSAGGTFSANMTMVAWVWPVAIALVIVRMLTKKQQETSK